MDMASALAAAAAGARRRTKAEIEWSLEEVDRRVGLPALAREVLQRGL